MTVSFNLLNDKWMPALRRAGQPPELLSLREALHDAPAWRGIHASSPLTTAALYRLCLAVLHAALRGPENPKQWKKWWMDKKWDARLDEYLEEWETRFDLFGAHAFWQVKEGVLDKDDAAMFLGMGADRNMGTLFDHRTARNALPLSLPQAAQLLVTAQTFKLGGGVSGGGFKNFTDAPWARGVIFFAEGDTLFETLALNLAQYPLPASVFKYQTADAADDIPVWESDDPFTPSDRLPRGYIDYLTWSSRRIRLLPPVETAEGWRVTHIQFAQGLALPKSKDSNDFWLDPAKGNQINEKPKGKQAPITPLKFETGRALWRDSAMLYDWRDKTLRRPHACSWISVLANEVGIPHPSQNLRLMAFGMATDKANIHFARAERLPLPVSFLKDAKVVSALSEATTMANETGDALERALFKLASGLTNMNYNPSGRETETADAEDKPRPRKGKGKKEVAETEEEEQEKKPQADKKLVQLVNTWGVDARFWDALEGAFEKFVAALDRAREDEQGRADARTTWQNALRQTAFETLGCARDYAGDNVNALRAGVGADEYLRMSLGKILPKAKLTEKEAQR